MGSFPESYTPLLLPVSFQGLFVTTGGGGEFEGTSYLPYTPLT